MAPDALHHVVFEQRDQIVGSDQSVACSGGAEKVSVGVEPSLVFVGVPDPHKRADLAIEALAAYRGKGGTRGLVFVGYHPPETRLRLQRLADRQKVGSQVQFWDRVDDGTLAGLYRTGILLAVSRREGFGLPPVECLLTLSLIHI